MNASDDSTQGNGTEAESERDTPLATVDATDLETGTANRRNDDLAGNF